MIKVENVVRNYQAGETIVKALRGVSLEIKKGEFLSIAGPSGSGKTTLLNLIGCIDQMDSGDITIKEEHVSKMKKKEKTNFRRNNLGFIFQTYNLIPVLTAYENVAFVLSLLNLPEKEVKERTMAILKEVGLEGMENRRPGRLSGGQQQRVATARALVNNPELILADETLYEHKGRIDFIDRNVDSSTGAILLQATFPNPDGLIRPGQFARVKAMVKEEKNALLVPQKSVSELQGQYSVFIVNSENMIESKQVKVGERIGEFLVIKDGLNDGDKVILEGVQKVRSGMEVVPEITEFKSQINSQN